MGLLEPKKNVQMKYKNSHFCIHWRIGDCPNKVFENVTRTKS